MPVIYQRLTERTLATGATKDDLIHIVIPSDISQDPDGSSYKITLEQLQPVFSANTFTGGSSNCITDLYTSNIHSCSPLNINPLDEGNVYFGSTSGVTIDVTNSRLGIGTENPQYPLDVVNADSRLYYDPTSVGGRFAISGVTNVPRFNVEVPPYLTKLRATLSLGMRAWDDLLYPDYGNPGDAHLYAGVNAYGLNIISEYGATSADYIRFYAGQDAYGTIPDVHIQGSGATRGYVGIGTSVPTTKLHVSGNTKIDGGLSTDTISATTYQNLPKDVRVTGGTYSAGTILFTNNTGGTFNVTGLTTGSTSTASGEYLPLSGGTVTGSTTFTNGLTANTISATTYQNLPTDIRVTGGTYSNGTTIFTNNTGGTFNVTGFYTGLTDNDRYVTGFTYNNNTFTISDNSGSTFNSTFNVVTGLTVNGVLSATTYQNLPTDVFVTGGTYGNGTTTFTNNTGGTFNVTGYYTGTTDNNQYVTGFTYNDNTFTIGDNSGTTFNTTINTMTGLTVNGDLSVTGNTTVKGITGTTAVFSGLGQSILTIIGSGTTLPLFTIVGSSGELFSVTDSLVGSLFSVNDISGLPILEVFSDNTTLMGDYLSPSLNTTKKVSAGLGTTNVYSIPTSAYTGAFFDYTVSDGTNLRAGNIMSIWSGTSINYTETSTTSLGSTTGITFNMVISGGTSAVLQTSGTTAGWSVKTIVRSI